MRLSRLIAVLMTLGVVAVGCGWSPPSAPPTTSVACTQADGPTAETTQQAVASLPQGAQWRETSRGHTPNCRLNWVVVSAGDASDSPQQVLFFDRNNSLGPATPEPRPYINVTTMGDDTVNVQYQWRQGQDPACCPTGIGAVRFKIEDGKLKALDPIPNP
ncbi:MAG TPA: LppP/LprE family lipoprotein [Mycobacterium sp.]|jgi:hypothetical protein